MQEYIEPEDVFDVNPKAEASGAGDNNEDLELEIDILTEDPVRSLCKSPLSTIQLPVF